MRANELDAQVEEELRSRWVGRLVEPALIEDCMVANFNQATGGINVPDISISSSKPDKNSQEVMLVEFCATYTVAFDANSGTKDGLESDVGV